MTALFDEDKDRNGQRYSLRCFLLDCRRAFRSAFPERADLMQEIVERRVARRGLTKAEHEKIIARREATGVDSFDYEVTQMCPHIAVIAKRLEAVDMYCRTCGEAVKAGLRKDWSGNHTLNAGGERRAT